MTRSDNVGQRVCVALVALLITVVLATFARHDVTAPDKDEIGALEYKASGAAAENGYCEKSQRDTRGLICVSDALWGKILDAESARWRRVRDAMWRFHRQSDYRQAVWAPTFSCPFEQRIGALAIGGKWVCSVERLGAARGDECVVYSFGIGSGYAFELELLNKTGGRCRVELFDPAADKRLTPRVDGLAVHKMGLVGAGKERRHFKSYDTLFKFENRSVKLVKMDIEGAERLVLHDIAKLPAKRRPQQLLVQVHWRPNTIDAMDAVLRNLRSAGYVIFHMERNFHTEVSFINLASRLAGGIQDAGFDLVTRSR